MGKFWYGKTLENLANRMKWIFIYNNYNYIHIILYKFVYTYPLGESTAKSVILLPVPNCSGSSLVDSSNMYLIYTIHVHYKQYRSTTTQLSYNIIVGHQSTEQLWQRSTIKVYE